MHWLAKRCPIPIPSLSSQTPPRPPPKATSPTTPTALAPLAPLTPLPSLPRLPASNSPGPRLEAFPAAVERAEQNEHVPGGRVHQGRGSAVAAIPLSVNFKRYFGENFYALLDLFYKKLFLLRSKVIWHKIPKKKITSSRCWQSPCCSAPPHSPCTANVWLCST